MNAYEIEKEETLASEFFWSEGQADREGAYAMGRIDTKRAWILTDRDVWYANPFYVGPPVPHPEDDY